jgi:hypothetical protein
MERSGSFCSSCGTALTQPPSSSQRQNYAPSGEADAAQRSGQKPQVFSDYPPVASTLPGSGFGRASYAGSNSSGAPAEPSGCAKAFQGFLKTFVTIVLLCIVVFSIWRFITPPDVDYSDVLTERNANTFADHNKHWASDDPENVAYVQDAMAHLGDKAYGRKFGDLMNWEKSYRLQIDNQQQAKVEAKRAALAAAGQAAVKYSDRLTRQNISSYATRNDGWANDDPANVKYVSDAIDTLGDKAFGRTFGDLMDFAKGAGLFADGQVAEIGPGLAGQQCPATNDQLHAYMQATIKNDSTGVQEALTGAIVLQRGEHVRAINHVGGLAEIIQLRIESGDDQGASCFEPSDIKEAFLNIRSDH